MSSRHEHKGRSSKEFIDAKSVLDKMGLSKGDTFLDIGCADGHFCIAASDMVSQAIGVDIDAHSITILKEKMIANVRAINADFTKGTDIAKSSVDIALICNVLHGIVHNQEIDSVKAELDRVMKPSGRLVVIEFKPDSPIGPPQEVRLSKDTILSLMNDFALIKEFDAGTYSFGLIFQGKA